MEIPNPRALVTGGAGRIGRAIALELAAAGFDLVLGYHQSEADAAETRRQVETLGRHCKLVCADLTDPESATKRLAEAAGTRLDVLVNNASLFLPGSLEQSSVELVRTLNAIHVESPMLLVQRLAGLLRKSRGAVINMCDLLAERPWPQYLAYSASKAALANLTLGLARELAPEATVNAVAPGVVLWPDDFPEDQRAQYLKKVPLGRAGTPQDVAALVRFLSTGGRYITGQIIRLDGGRSIMA